jgi:hypothetical protein
MALSHQGKGLGGVLLVRALRKAYENADVVGHPWLATELGSDSVRPPLLGRRGRARRAHRELLRRIRFHSAA